MKVAKLTLELFIRHAVTAKVPRQKRVTLHTWHPYDVQEALNEARNIVSDNKLHRVSTQLCLSVVEEAHFYNDQLCPDDDKI